MKLTGWQASVAVALIILTSAIYAALIPATNVDMVGFVLPWYGYILQHGAVQFLASDVANYTPPYLYLLVIGSMARDFLSPLVVIKLISILGNCLLGLGVHAVLVRFIDRWKALVFAIGSLLLPTVALDGPYWGQTDAIYTGLAMFGLSAVLGDRPARAMLFFGAALAIKLQIIFLAPLILHLLFSRRILVRHCVAGILMAVGMMIPAILCGRPIASVLTIYAGQAGFYESLSMAAPNLWSITTSLNLVSYEVGVAIGLGLGLVATTLIAATAYRARILDPAGLLLVAAVSTIWLPFVLPKMHDRYFFMADILAAVIAVTAPSVRTIGTAILQQIASLLAMSAFLFGHWNYPKYGAIFMGGAAAWTLLAYVVRVRGHSAGTLGQGRPFLFAKL